jgi:hypothetical protein
MRHLIVSSLVVLILAAQTWADCAWVLIQEKSFPEDRISDPYISVIPVGYFEGKKDCDDGKKSKLQFEGMVKDQTFNKQLGGIVRKDDKGREAYYTYECIPSNVLSLYIKAER